MTQLNYKTHPFLLAAILATIIALCNYIMIEFIFDYQNIIFGTDSFNNLSKTPKFPPHDSMPPIHHHDHHPPLHTPHIYFTIKQIISIFSLAFLLYSINFYIYNRQLTISKQSIYTTLSTIIITVIFCAISIQIDFYLRSLHDPHLAGPQLHQLIKSAITRDAYIALFVGLSSLLMYYIQRQEQIRLTHETLIAENLRSRYNALTAQLDPHFLFNSLNTLKALIKSDPQKAQDYTQQLSDIFRFTTKHNDIISVKEEIDFSQTYANMMLMRYENNLSIIYNVEPKYLNYQILPFAIQTLIENAIKHNTITTKCPLTIEILSDDSDHILVRNHKKPKKNQNTTNGLGLKNLNDRHRYQFNTQIEISNTNEQFSVRIPIIKPH